VSISKKLATPYLEVKWDLETTSKDYLQMADKYLVGSRRTGIKLRKGFK
jgi:hypothetical protein